MNQRIQKLAEQAGLISAEYNGFDPTGLTTAQRKFAELIVRECIDIISPYTIRMGRPGEEFLHPIQEIRKHFGVEE